MSIFFINMFCGSSSIQATSNNFGLNMVGAISRNTLKRKKSNEIVQRIISVGTVRNKFT